MAHVVGLRTITLECPGGGLPVLLPLLSGSSYHYVDGIAPLDLKIRQRRLCFSQEVY